MSDIVRVEREDTTAIVTLNQPEKRNPISGLAMIDALEATMRALDDDLTVRAVILTGEGTAFSSGGDLNAMVAPKSSLRDPVPAQTRRNYRAGIQRLPLLFEALEVPVIAAVNGAAIGAGCDLACMCDIRIAGERAKFAESFVKLGIVPGDGGAWLLPRIIGFAKASELALTGEMLDATQALACGLVSRVVPDDALMAEARSIAAKIAANPPHAVRMTKRLLREGHRATLASILELSAAMQALGHATADHDEAVRAFIEKRAPTFTGA
ncbi:crotonase/enoyl-CoA hydratase family protein [Hephaestia sp. GCM10023244]|uniref:crotonase/enoyl-CoA hydratase family protein n=1 Tax=unclassified Hephaestia TaxID=2631281 RepID=UPI0020777DC8|nr:crotonase/enoyl-CoA hydratase family protein [Hephaestia sp. MAHUQ-44]MCM8731638.1 crotonase/enoyl-CoA hydratase family protein [Hephaestia sp. MAHUQ-44]